MWCLGISSMTAETLTGINLLDAMFAPFHKTSGSVVKPFFGCRTTDRRKTAAKTARKLYSTHKLKAAVELVSSSKNVWKPGISYTVGAQIPNEMAVVDSLGKKKRESSALFSDSFLRTVLHELCWIFCIGALNSYKSSVLYKSYLLLSELSVPQVIVIWCNLLRYTLFKKNKNISNLLFMPSRSWFFWFCFACWKDRSPCLKLLQFTNCVRGNTIHQNSKAFVGNVANSWPKQAK